MSAFTFNATAFRMSYPAFANTTLFPTATLQAYWDTATNFINANPGGCITDAQRLLALNLMTAHLAALSVLIANGETPGMVTSATIDKITVTLLPPPLRTQYQWWLNLTPYGQQLAALAQVATVGGFYAGGSAPRLGFRGPVIFGGGCC